MLEWYGYKHINGTIHLKRFLGDPLDISEARASPFVREVVGPFEALNQHEARERMKALLA